MKIRFRYSIPYDRMLSVMSMNDYSLKQKILVEDYILKFGEFWNRDEKKILKEIEKVAGMKFKRKLVDCYFVKEMAFLGISHPLTLKLEKNFNKARLILIHELIHVLLVDNPKSLDLIHELIVDYPKSNRDFKVHLPIFLIQKKVVENLYGKGYFKKNFTGDLTFGSEYILDVVDRMYPDFDKGIIKFIKKK